MRAASNDVTAPFAVTSHSKPVPCGRRRPSIARDLVIEGNETSHSAIEHGIYVSNSGDRPIVRANRVHDNHASGIQLNADPAQQGPDPNDPQGDGIIEDALIEDNVIHDNGAGGAAGINLASVRSSLIRNNLLYEMPQRWLWWQ